MKSIQNVPQILTFPVAQKSSRIKDQRTHINSTGGRLQSLISGVLACSECRLWKYVRHIRSLQLFLMVIISPYVILEASEPLRIETLYGVEWVEEPLILELISSPIMQRLKGVDQSGFSHYMGRIGPYSRFIHSFGVYLLLKRFDADFKEQVAGLLHDASHTVFSHGSDWLFYQGSHETSYQDNIHAWYLEQQNIDKIISKYGMTLQEVLVKGNGYDLLEQDLPDLCVDRLEYNLYTGYIMRLLTKEDVNSILDDLHYEKGKWFFEDPFIAAKFARVSIFFTEHLWGAKWNAVMNELSAKALRRALQLGVIDVDDIHFGMDQDVLEKLYSVNDAEINELLVACNRVENSFVECKPEEADYYCKSKFRGINPLVQINGEFHRLTELDGNFAAYYCSVKEKIARGVYVKFAR